MKKILSMLLAVIMLLGMIPFGALSIFAEDGEAMFEDGKEISNVSTFYAFYYQNDEKALEAGCVARIENPNSVPAYTLTLRAASAFAKEGGTVYLLKDIDDTGLTVYYTPKAELDKQAESDATYEQRKAEYDAAMQNFDQAAYDAALANRKEVEDGIANGTLPADTPLPQVPEKPEEPTKYQAVKASQGNNASFDNGARTFTFDGQGHTLSCHTGNKAFDVNGKTSGMLYKNFTINASTFGNQVALQTNTGDINLLPTYTFENVTVTTDQVAKVGLIVVQRGSTLVLKDCNVYTTTSQETYAAYNNTSDQVNSCIRMNNDGKSTKGGTVHITGNTTISSAFGSAIVSYSTWNDTIHQSNTINVNTTGSITGGLNKTAIASGGVGTVINVFEGKLYSGGNASVIHQRDGIMNIYGGEFESSLGNALSTNPQANVAPILRQKVNISGGTIKAAGSALTANSADISISGGSFTSETKTAITASNCNLDISKATVIANSDDAAGSNYALHGSNSNINIYSGTFETKYAAAACFANLENRTNIYGGSFTTKYGAHNQSAVIATNGITNIHGGSFNNGQFGVIWAYGDAKLNIYDGEFYFNENYSDGVSENFGVVIMGRDAQNTTVSIYGGTYTQAGSANKPCILNNSTSEATQRIIYGGTFTNGSRPFNGTEYPEGKNTYSIAPTMSDGASVRIAENSNGIRFTSIISSSVLAHISSVGGTIVRYGTIIAPMDFVSCASNFTTTALNEADIPGIPTTAVRYVDIVADGGMKADSLTGDVIISAALVNIKSENLTREFAARSYIVYSIGEGDNTQLITLYSNFNEDNNARSMQQIAQMSLADVKTEADDKYAHEVSSYLTTSDNVTFTEVTGKAYSPYTAEQIALIKQYLTVA